MRLMAHPGFLLDELRGSGAEDGAGGAVPGAGYGGLVLPEGGLRRGPPAGVGVPQGAGGHGLPIAGGRWPGGHGPPGAGSGLSGRLHRAEVARGLRR